MLVTHSGGATFVKELHPSKALSSMLATDVGMATLLSKIHPPKALYPTLGLPKFALYGEYP